MKQNKYDDPAFFDKYSQMDRSVKGLSGAGEWHELQKLLPGFAGKRVLDLGCGFGWHCIYALEQGAASAVGVDISEKMLEEARRKTGSGNARYLCLPMEEVDFPDGSFDVVISSLAFHYIPDFGDICHKVYRFLREGGDFVFSVEHPVFTAQGGQSWHCDEAGNILHWPVDRYFTEGRRDAVFLGEDVVKYHKTLTTYIDSLLTAGFSLKRLVEPRPAEHLMEVPGMADELRRPMMLLISAAK